MVSPYLDRPLREFCQLWEFEREWVNMIYGNIGHYVCFAYERDGKYLKRETLSWLHIQS